MGSGLLCFENIMLLSRLKWVADFTANLIVRSAMGGGDRKIYIFDLRKDSESVGPKRKRYCGPSFPSLGPNVYIVLF